ncbi:MAG: DUF805 domain-containing protein [Clostridiales bacterium]|uniref:DUF805 domain-containing protein n=1 Tax=Aminipila sp. TaxID=2060095 RepID=UPI001DB9C758|nr:DUF805 domain-containing protein [Aminipila sp.]MBE6035904.1 DUF805 domain-containing protein [Clostridiales bacterium]
MNWYLQVLKKYAVFSGRARRKEYWMFQLFNAIILAAIALLGVVHDMFFILYIIYVLAMIIPALAVTVRRLHDLDKEGVWILISFVPVVGGIWLLILTCTEGIRGDNRYGADPKAVELIDAA